MFSTVALNKYIGNIGHANYFDVFPKQIV